VQTVNLCPWTLVAGARPSRAISEGSEASGAAGNGASGAVWECGSTEHLLDREVLLGTGQQVDLQGLCSRAAS